MPFYSPCHSKLLIEVTFQKAKDIAIHQVGCFNVRVVSQSLVLFNPRWRRGHPVFHHIRLQVHDRSILHAPENQCGCLDLLQDGPRITRLKIVLVQGVRASTHRPKL